MARHDHHGAQQAGEAHTSWYSLGSLAQGRSEQQSNWCLSVVFCFFLSLGENPER
jgi:hypothetical protein